MIFVPEEKIVEEGDPPMMLCVDKVFPSAEDIIIRVEIVDADGEFTSGPTLFAGTVFILFEHQCLE